MALWPGCELNCHSCRSQMLKIKKEKKKTANLALLQSAFTGKDLSPVRRGNEQVRSRGVYLHIFGRSLCLGGSPPLRSSGVELLSRPVWIPLQEAAGRS